MKHHGNVTKINGAEVEPVDVIIIEKHGVSDNGLCNLTDSKKDE